MHDMTSADTSTICAIATPPGGALGIIRLSGPQAIEHTAALFTPAGKRLWPTRQGGTVTFGEITDPSTGETVDEVLVSLFRNPHSYTGEDCTEISCHGSSYIMNRILQLLIAQGCRMAKAGEYTERAFLNGKMDLSQAEAVADLIASSTAANHRMAMRQMRGAFSGELHALRDQLLHITALLELELDFSDHEDLEFASRDELAALAHQIHDRISRLCQSFRLGNALKRGVPVAIVGETNAGKSTLLNALIGEERALVSDVHGTTRDTVEETVVIDGSLVRFIDTAGIRQTKDTVERMGIRRTFDKIEEADIVLWVIDATEAREQYRRLCHQVEHSDKLNLLIVNKSDLLDERSMRELQNFLEQAEASAHAVQREQANMAADPEHEANTPPLTENETSQREDTNLSTTKGNVLAWNVAATARYGRPLNQPAHPEAGYEGLPTESQNAPTGNGESPQSAYSRPLQPPIHPQFLSARSTQDIERLRHALSNILSQMQQGFSVENEVIVSNARHYEALSQALAAIDRVADGLTSHLSGDFVAQDLRECIHHLSDIAGDVTTNAVLHTIFERFCVGK